MGCDDDYSDKGMKSWREAHGMTGNVCLALSRCSNYLGRHDPACPAAGDSRTGVHYSADGESLGEQARRLLVRNRELEEQVAALTADRERCARQRAAKELRAAADSPDMDDVLGGPSVSVDQLRSHADFLDGDQ